MHDLETVLGAMLGSPAEGHVLPLLDPEPWLGRSISSDEDAVAVLNATFLLTLCGGAHQATACAGSLLEEPPAAAPAGLAEFYRRGLGLIREEVRERSASDPDVAARLRAAAERVGHQADADSMWPIFFPEGLGILGHEQERISELRARRTVTVTRLNPRPMGDPATEVLFTSNVLLTVPAATTDIERLPYPEDMRRELRLAAGEPQQHWYDHPIQIGVAPERNELIYGLRGLDEAIAFERGRRPGSRKVGVALSVSVTHERLQRLAHAYVREELARAGGLKNLDVYVFTESECRRLADEVLAPATAGDSHSPPSDVLGVDGEYGRHYSFLKAIAALWSVLIDPQVRATFKIDLDQVFPQDVLVEETGSSAFEHMVTPLWGATGIDSDGRPVELGMIAGALVNERDIGRGLFTPDVAFPDGPATPDEYVFFSRLPQALSTRAEMMERYDTPERDGRRACLERVHVTGGTNGILVDALRRHRPFTPSFIGRAEDQAYIVSALGDGDGADKPRLTYAHAAGLIMRHDKEAFAGEAIEAARVGKLVGDDVRILYFSAYADVIGRERVKALLDPFTGCFISALPATVVLLRFALRIAHALERGDAGLGLELAGTGAPRIAQALAFTGDRDAFGRVLEAERSAWNSYFEALERLETGLAEGEAGAVELRSRAQEIVAGAAIGGTAGQEPLWSSA